MGDGDDFDGAKVSKISVTSKKNQSYSVKNSADKVVDSSLVVGVGVGVHAVGYDRAYGHGAVSHQTSESLKRC